MVTPPWALSLAFWLHMLATVTWIGGLASLAMIVFPAARKSLNAQDYARFINEIQRRFDPLAWFSLLILAGTGMLQMSANPNYQGFMSFENPWAFAILLKHILFIIMTILSGVLTWVILPRLTRLALLRARRKTDADQEDDWVVQENRFVEQEERLLRLNLVAGVLILALTAIARVA